MHEVRRRYFESLKLEAEEKVAGSSVVISKFKEYCLDTGFRLDDETISYEHGIGLIVRHDNILTYICPDLIVDKDGLYDFNQLSRTYEKLGGFGTSGMFAASNFIMMASPFFRRSMNLATNWYPNFIDLFWRLNLPNSSVKIALDIHCIEIGMKEYGKIELDTWYGAPFSTDISQIKDGLIRLCPPIYLDDVDLKIFFGSAYSLHIKWSSENKIKTFQAEAFLQSDILIEYEDDIWHPVHYAHAEWDLEKETFRHFDGAIHFYQPQDYMIARDQDLDYNLKNGKQIKAKSKKLFRIDNDLDFKTWIDLTTNFFPKNPLILEYFLGKYPDHLEDTLRRIRVNLNLD